MLSLLLLGTVVLAGCQSAPVNNLYSEKSISHAHGLAVDSADPNKLYVATHYGLLVLVDEKDLYRIGKAKDDYMGFSVHPTTPQTFFSSGHPSTGGNLGIQKSEDGGVTWQKIGNGVNGPVDFHEMTVNTANPNILFGWYNNELQRSFDGGKTWEIVETSLPNILQLVTDSQDENVVFATTLQGLMRSSNKGSTWENISQDLKDGIVVTVAVHPQYPKKLLSFSKKLGLARSTDGGITWEKMGENFDGELLLYIVFDKNTTDKVYTLTKNNVVWKSSNGGNSWSKIR